MKTSLIDSFIKICGQKNVFINEPMKNRTTFKIGGNADFFLTPQTIDAFKAAVDFCKESGEKIIILGNGSNVLVSDLGIKKTVISTSALNKIEANGTKLYSMSGALLSAVSNAALKHSLAGLEFAGGIPGSLGGGIFMNAGAYGGELKDVIESVTFLAEDGEIKTLSAKECCFGYRKSVFQTNGGIILSASFNLTYGDSAQIASKLNDFNSRRREKQPLNMPSAGSTFKRPEGHFAGGLIEKSGLKGFKIGGAQVSEKHSGFVVNADNATAKDVIELIEYIKNTVYEKFGVRLEEEVRYID